MQFIGEKGEIIQHACATLEEHVGPEYDSKRSIITTKPLENLHGRGRYTFL